MTHVQDRKAALRTDLLAARAGVSAAARGAAADAVRRHVTDLDEVRAARTVAAYVSTAAELGTEGLLDAFASTGIRVLLPVLASDLDLDWAVYDGPGTLAAASRGLREPTGARLGPQAVADAEVLLVPAVAADRVGHRLGRGGGSYDRALARVPAGRLVVALLFDEGFVEDVPADSHDQLVDVVVTPSNVHRTHRAHGAAARSGG